MGVDAKMLVKTRSTEVTEKHLQLWSYRLGEAFGADNFFMTEEHGALSFVDEYFEDGPSIFPEVGEKLIEVHLMSRYYGEGYERGPFHLLVSIAEWLEFNIPGAEVWYGGDSSGIRAERFDRKRRDEMRRHFFTVGGLPYRDYFQTGISAESLCPRCELPMHAFSWGPGATTGYRCLGCGFEREIKVGGDDE